MRGNIATMGLLSAILFLAAACHKDTLQEMPAEVKLNDGTTIDCPGGMGVGENLIFCYRNKTDHDNIRIDRTSVTGYSTKPPTPKIPQ